MKHFCNNNTQSQTLVFGCDDNGPSFATKSFVYLDIDRKKTQWLEIKQTQLYTTSQYKSDSMPIEAVLVIFLKLYSVSYM